jgi:hypothetical protein
MQELTASTNQTDKLKEQIIFWPMQMILIYCIKTLRQLPGYVNPDLHHSNFHIL